MHDTSDRISMTFLGPDDDPDHGIGELQSAVDATARFSFRLVILAGREELDGIGNVLRDELKDQIADAVEQAARQLVTDTPHVDHIAISYQPMDWPDDWMDSQE